MTTQDAELLRRYSEEGSESAFTALVQRHLGLVYASAMRRLSNDPHRAGEVAQLVFTSLAKNARRLSRHPALSAWLFTSTRNAALTVLRAESRRRARERALFSMTQFEQAENAAPIEWDRVRLVIDRALDELGEADRTAVLLRFFEKKSFARIGEALGASEDAARVRTDRALEKLRTILTKRGVDSTAAALGAVLSTSAVVGAPPALTAGVAQSALAGVATPGLFGTSILSSMSSISMKCTAIATVLVGVAAVAYVARPSQPSRLSVAASQQRDSRAPETLSRSPASPRAGIAGSADASSSKFAQGEWTGESDLKATDLSTPVAAYETFLHFATGGDVAGTAATLFLTDDARSRAEKLLASLPAEKRVDYPTAESLFASLFIGASALTANTANHPSAMSYKLETVEPGVRILPLAVGLPDAVASDSAYQTVKSRARSGNGKESEPVAVFFKTADGWKWIVPPSMIDAFGRMLKGSGSKK